MRAETRTSAMLLFGRVPMMIRHAAIITESCSRSLAPLLIGWGDESKARQFSELRQDTAHAFAHVAEAFFWPEPAVEPILAQVSEWRTRYDIQGVLSCGEIFVEPAGMAADLLGLPGPGLRAARVCRNKHLQRSYLAEWSPVHRLVLPGDQAAAAGRADRFPVVVKPVGRTSSSGVRLVRSAAELAEVTAAYPSDEWLLVEERVEGPEFSVEALVQDGRVFWESITAKVTTETSSSFFAELEHTVPATGLSPGDAQALISANQGVLAALDFRDGISHAEFRVCDGRAVLMEIAARLPGDGITILYELATGQPVEPVLLDIALGLPASYPVPLRQARHHYVQHPFGRLVDVKAPSGVPITWMQHDGRWPRFDPVGANEPARTCGVLVNRRVGDHLGPITDSDERAVSVMVDAPLDGSIEPITAAAAASLRVEVSGDGG
ncbi:MAG TPA: ATP-grasp domain-containing protein [Mycobacteriales bacterium]|nr:ATP-grasp domain-containing protein [Mycobacteriales bacterium]